MMVRRALAICSGVGVLVFSVSAFAGSALPGFNPSSRHTPSIQELLHLSPQARTRYFDAVKGVLLEMDARAHTEEETSNWIFEQLVCSAYAGDDLNAPFCINLGMLKEVGTADGDCQAGPGMHNFDTNGVLSKYNLNSAAACSSTKGRHPMIPCSPVFGFKSDGTLNCASTNTTATCDRLSKGEGEISLGDVLISCGTKGSADPVKADCKKLLKFTEDQIALARKYCGDTPDKKACGILRAQDIQFGAQLKDKREALSVGDVDKMNQYLDQIKESSKVAATVAPCTPTEPAKPVVAAPVPPPPPPAPVVSKPAAPSLAATVPAAAPASTSSAPCVGAVIKPTADQSMTTILSAVASTLHERNQDLGCMQVTLTDKSVLKVVIDQKNISGSIQPFNQFGKQVDPIALDQNEIVGMIMLSEGAKSTDGLHLPLNQLFNSYIPSSPIAKDLKMTYQGVDYPSVGWTTLNGSQVQYVPKDVTVNGKAMALVEFKAPMTSDWKVVSIPVSDDPDSSDSATAASPKSAR
jgi:hypothetical protein